MPAAADRPTMPWCSTRAQLAHRPEDLDAEHQDDQQRLERHRAGLDPPGAESSAAAAPRRSQVGDAARHDVGRQHPMVRSGNSRAPRPRACRPRVLWPNAFRVARPWIESRNSAAKRLRRLVPTGTSRRRTCATGGRREQRHQREAQHHRRDRQVRQRDKARRSAAASGRRSGTAAGTGRKRSGAARRRRSATA